MTVKTLPDISFKISAFGDTKAATMTRFVLFKCTVFFCMAEIFCFKSGRDANVYKHTKCVGLHFGISSIFI